MQWMGSCVHQKYTTIICVFKCCNNCCNIWVSHVPYATVTNLSTEDIVHHVVSCLFVPIIGCLCPFGKIVAVSNLGMCGIPGAIDYFLLTCVKHNFVGKQRKIHKSVVKLLRWPLMFLSSYLSIVGLMQGVLDTQPNYVKAAMLPGMFLHSFNAVYYCDKVVGNYNLTKQSIVKKN